MVARPPFSPCIVPHLFSCGRVAAKSSTKSSRCVEFLKGGLVVPTETFCCGRAVGSDRISETCIEQRPEDVIVLVQKSWGGDYPQKRPGPSPAPPQQRPLAACVRPSAEKSPPSCGRLGGRGDSSANRGTPTSCTRTNCTYSYKYKKAGKKADAEMVHSSMYGRDLVKAITEQARC